MEAARKAFPVGIIGRISRKGGEMFSVFIT